MPFANVSATRRRFHLVRDYGTLEQVGECGLVICAVIERIDPDIGDKIVAAVANIEDLDVVIGVRRSLLVLEEVVSLIVLEVVLENRR